MVPVTKGKQKQQNTDMKDNFTVSKTVDAKKVVDDKGVVTREWPEALVTVDYSTLTKDIAEDTPGGQAMLQHLKKYAGFLLQHDASTAHRADKASGDGPGWKWDNVRKILTVTLTPWTVRESGAEKLERENAAILHKVDEKVRSGEVPEAMRAIVAQLAGYKGTLPPYKA